MVNRNPHGMGIWPFRVWVMTKSSTVSPPFLWLFRGCFWPRGVKITSQADRLFWLSVRDSTSFDSESVNSTQDHPLISFRHSHTCSSMTVYFLPAPWFAVFLWGLSNQAALIQSSCNLRPFYSGGREQTADENVYFLEDTQTRSLEKRPWLLSFFFSPSL